MNILVIIALTLILLPVAGLLINHVYVNQKLRRYARQKFIRMEPLLKKLDSRSPIDETEIIEIADDPALRHAVYNALESYGRLELFPAEYLTREKGAECFLVNWLEYPTELGQAPDEIELLSVITIPDDEPLDYYVFRYRTESPHWAAKYNWMLGVAGPYRKDSLPYDVPLRVFSRFNELNSVSPETEVEWVHNHIGQA
jgi:hypothetical protein